MDYYGLRSLVQSVGEGQGIDLRLEPGTDRDQFCCVAHEKTGKNASAGIEYPVPVHMTDWKGATESEILHETSEALKRARIGGLRTVCDWCQAELLRLAGRKD